MTTTTTDVQVSTTTLFDSLVGRFTTGESDLPRRYEKRVQLWAMLMTQSHIEQRPIPAALLARYQRTLGASVVSQTKKGVRS